jgi:exodeoxyribonuclease VII small subunit
MPEEATPAISNVGFEEALRKLEETVKSIEGGDTTLAELLERYEEGTRLLGICEQRLKEAELRLEQLRQTKDGVALEKFTTTRS